MLVKRSIVEAWYQRDSWVYRNFEFLFKNPIWNKKVPAGFSVCPYFWLSLLSLCIVRPLVFGLTRIVIPLLALGGLPLKALDRWIGEKAVGNKAYSPGVGLGLVFAASVGLALLAVTGLWLVGVYQSVATVAGGTLGWWLLWSGVATGLTVGWYNNKNKHRPDRCKAEIWLIVWLVAAVVIGIGSNPVGFLGFLGKLWAGSWECISSIGWALGVAAAWCGSVIWTTIKLAAAGAWIVLSYAPFPQLYLPWWAYFLGATWLIARLGDRVLSATGNTALQQPKRELDTAAIDRELNRTGWKQLLRAAYQQDGLHEMIADMLENELVTSPRYREKFGIEHWSWKQIPAVLRFEVGDVIDQLIEQRYGAFLNAVENHKPVITFWSWSQLNTSVKRSSKLRAVYETVIKPVTDELVDSETWDTWWALHLIDAGVTNHEVQPAVTSWFEKLTPVQTTRIRVLHNCYVASAAEEERRQANRWKAKQAGWAARTCKRVTENTWAGCLAIGRMISKFFFNLWVFIVYLWELLKARKQGACPYIMFKD